MSSLVCLNMKNKTPRMFSRCKLKPTTSANSEAMICEYLYLGEIPNMTGHCAVIDDTGHVEVGYHVDDFREMTDEEI